MAGGGTNLAKAYVQIIPSADGIKGNLESLLGGEGDAAGKSAGGKFSSAFGAALKIGAAALSAAAAGVGAMVSAAVSSYADYEQLVGGIETLFSSLDGTVSAAPQVLANAENAYRTAGLSVNEYMETVTSFSAALVSSLDGDYAEAARISDMAITDMSDNANKMGTSMESIQMAYQGFAKQNYTMLDNLKLGYGGTKSEMERLLADAEAITGIHYDINNLNDVYEAIHVIQGEMGITGTTAEEAASTISGSLSMTKAAWANLMTGIADSNADLSGLIDNLVSSAGALASNIMPVVSQALQGVGDLVVQLAPIIAAQLPALITSVLPGLLSAGEALLEGLMQGIVTAIPALAPAAASVLVQLAGFLIQNLPMIIDVGLQMIPALINGIAEALPQLIGYLPELILSVSTTILDNLPLIVAAGIQLLSAVLRGVVQAVPQLIGYMPQIISSLFRALVGGVGQMLSAGARLLSSVMQGIRSGLSGLASIGMNIVRGIWQGISNGLGWIKSMITGWVGNVKNFLKSLFGINSPSTWARDMLGVNIARGIGVGFEDEMVAVERSMEGAMPDLSGSVQFEARTVPVRAAVFSDNAERGGFSAESESAILAELRATREAIQNMGIYLDDGTLVGRVNQGLGMIRAGETRRKL